MGKRKQLPGPVCEWAQAIKRLHHGDLLLWWAGWGLSDCLISNLSRSPYVHAGRAALEYGEWRCLDVVQRRGGRNVSLRDEVIRAPGRIDVFRPLPDVANASGCAYSADQAVEIVKALVGTPYGWLNLLRLGLLQFTLPRLVVPPDIDDKPTSTYPPYCSAAQAIADAEAGCDPCPNLPHRLTTPGDLARSLLYARQFRMVP